MDFKMLVLQSHYRSQSNFSWEALEAAKLRVKKYQSFADLQFQTKQMPARSTESFTQSIKKIKEELSADLNSTLALILVDVFSDVMLEDELPEANKSDHQDYLAELDNLLDFNLKSREDIVESQKQIIAEREAARKNDDYAKSDQLRDKLLEQGIGLRDTAHGTIWYRT